MAGASTLKALPFFEMLAHFSFNALAQMSKVSTSQKIQNNITALAFIGKSCSNKT